MIYIDSRGLWVLFEGFYSDARERQRPFDCGTPIFYLTECPIASNEAVDEK